MIPFVPSGRSAALLLASWLACFPAHPVATQTPRPNQQDGLVTMADVREKLPGNNTRRLEQPGLPTLLIGLSDKWGLCVFEQVADGRVRPISFSCNEDEYSNLAMATAVLDAHRVGKNRLVIQLHVNPSSSTYVDVDLSTGKARGVWAAAYAWSEDGKHTAYIGGYPHFHLPTDKVPSEVYVDYRKVAVVEEAPDWHLKWDGREKMFCLVCLKRKGIPKVYLPAD